jgi:hypothetical protein
MALGVGVRVHPKAGEQARAEGVGGPKPTREERKLEDTGRWSRGDKIRGTKDGDNEITRTNMP